MPKEPTQIFFDCDGCRKRVTPRVIRRWAGICRKCESESWTLCANYSETSYGCSIFGLLAWFLFDRGWSNSTTHTTQVASQGITPEIAQKLTGEPSLVRFQVTQFLHQKELQELHTKGAQNCQVCNSLFVPVAEKSWTAQGFCSNACAAQDGFEVVAADSSEETPETENQPSFTTTVECPNGHKFEVMVSFSGMLRPCAECGAKTRVP